MADLRSLILLRNDPDAAAELLQEAEKGDVDAQYGMGLVYADGRGMPVDEVRAFFWLTRAIEQGDKDAEKLRRIVAMRMTDDQFDAAEQLLKEKKTLVRAGVGSAGAKRRGSNPKPH